MRLFLRQLQNERSLVKLISSSDLDNEHPKRYGWYRLSSNILQRSGNKGLSCICPSLPLRLWRRDFFPLLMSSSHQIVFFLLQKKENMSMEFQWKRVSGVSFRTGMGETFSGGSLRAPNDAHGWWLRWRRSLACRWSQLSTPDSRLPPRT